MSADQSLTQRQRRRLLIRVMLRVLATITVVVALYYIFPLDRLDGIPVFLPLAAALLLLIVAGVLEMRAVVRPRTPRSEPSNRWPDTSPSSWSCSRPPTTSWQGRTRTTSASTP
jgi:hypothetical protein